MKINHTSEQELKRRLGDAKSKIETGAKYCHYKNPDQYYHIVAVGMIEETETPAVIYRAEYGDNIVWVRPVENFLSKVKHNGKIVDRFQHVKEVK